MAKTYTFSVPPRADPRNRRLLPNVVDETAAAEPDAVWSEISVSPTSYDAGFRPITWKMLANAVNGLAALLEARLGRGRAFETLVYLGPSDPRTPMMVLASIKAGFKPLLSSPRNSLAAHENLFTTLAVRTVVTTSPQPPFVPPVLAAFPAMRLVEIPSIDELLTTPYPHYPYGKTYEDAKHEPMLCLHTSGSTGLPKPIVYPHEFVTTAINIAQLQPPDGYELVNTRLAATRGIMLLPLFHIGGVHFGLFSTIMNRDILIFPLATEPPTGASLGAMLSKTDADWAFLAPTQIEDIPKDPKLFDLVASKLKMLLTSGGSLSPAVGDVLSARVHLRSFLGSSEHSGFPHLIPKGATRSGKDWSYIELHPYVNAEFRGQGEGSFELVVNRNEQFKEWQTPFVIFPETSQFRTKDLFAPHPTEKGRWIHQGRDDDIIVLSNGEKTNPVSFEDVIASSPWVKSALVFGSGRFEAGVLIELVPDETAKSDLLDRIYAVVETANTATPAHARIAKSHVLFADTSKPFLRSGKGTVQRQLTLKAFDAEIDALYQSVDLPQHGGTNSAHRNGTAQKSNRADCESTILDAVKQITGLAAVDSRENLLSLGLDSLQALRLARQLRAKLGCSEVTPSLIYENPSVQALAAKLTSDDGMNGFHTTTPLSATEAVYQKHLAYMQVLASCTNQGSSKTEVPRSSTHTVLLTGASGFLGGHILASLLANPSVSHVYCLNRRALKVASNSRVTHIEADLAHPITMGIPADTYAKIRASVTLIIHAAWPVDFIQPVVRFERSLAGTIHLSLFAAAAHRNPVLLFLSSVSAVGNLDTSSRPVVSAVIDDPTAPTLGYGESKHVAERLVGYVAATFGVRAGFARLGQIAGPARRPGTWNEKEWLPRLIRSARAMGAVPNSLGPRGDVLEWIAVDDAGEIVVDLGMALTEPAADGARGAKVFNVVNPRPGSWRDAVDKIQAVLKGTKLVERGEWLDQLQKAGAGLETKASSAELGQTLERYPALPLEAFYQSLFNDRMPLRMDTRSAEAVSKTLKDLPQVDNEAVVRWIRGILEE